MEDETNMSATIGQIAGALAKAQAGFGELVKDKKATVKMKAGGEYTYAYSNLADAIEVIRAPLAAQEVALVQQVSTTQRSVRVRTLLLHSSGEWIASTMEGGADTDDMRTLGGTVSYLRRYALLALVGLAADDDDGASHKPPPKAKAKPEPRAGVRTPSAATESGGQTFPRGKHHPSFTEEEGRNFAIALSKLAVPLQYERVATWIEGDSPAAINMRAKLNLPAGRPSAWDKAARVRLYKECEFEPGAIVLAIESATSQQGD